MCPRRWLFLGLRLKSLATTTFALFRAQLTGRQKYHGLNTYDPLRCPSQARTITQSGRCPMGRTMCRRLMHRMAIGIPRDRNPLGGSQLRSSFMARTWGKTHGAIITAELTIQTGILNAAIGYPTVGNWATCKDLWGHWLQLIQRVHLAVNPVFLEYRKPSTTLG